MPNFQIGEKDMQIILDALETLHGDLELFKICGIEDRSIQDSRGYTADDVDSLFQAFDNASIETSNTAE